MRQDHDHRPVLLPRLAITVLGCGEQVDVGCLRPGTECSGPEHEAQDDSSGEQTLFHGFLQWFPPLWRVDYAGLDRRAEISTPIGRTPETAMQLERNLA